MQKQEHTLIANSGIQIITLPLSINTQDKAKMWFHEWYDTENGVWCLDHVYELRTEDGCYYYNKKKLFEGGYLTDSSYEFDVNELKEDGITPLRIDDENCEGVKGDIYSMSFSSRDNKLSAFENVWLPVPYFFKRTEKKFFFGPFNWSRMKLIPKSENKGLRQYDVVLAFDTRVQSGNNEQNECPSFQDRFENFMDFALCDNDYLLMDYCSPGQSWSYIDEYLFHRAYPNIPRIGKLKGEKKMAYVASYIFLVEYLARQCSFPTIKLYKDDDVIGKDVDMVIDIGNSRTTALLVEDNNNFNQIRELELTDYTNLFSDNGTCLKINRHNEPFDMRLVFRKVSFGNIGAKDSRQFVYPSLVRLGQEANTLIHMSSVLQEDENSLCSYSSPKRYLWDARPHKAEWRYMVLDNEKDDHILNLNGITNQLRNDGTLEKDGNGGASFHYSRRSLMTFCFLEMLVQAETQINGEEYRSIEKGLGEPSLPRKIKRLIVTCPTAMSKIERQALIHCAEDAVSLLDNFKTGQTNQARSIEVIPSIHSKKDGENEWYYDEATCSQLVYMYGEAGQKYKGVCEEFFKLYGKKEEGESQPSITVGSLDIGAGTSDLMISKYTYTRTGITTITPSPEFYDSYYFAGDDMLHSLIKSIMILSEDSAFRTSLNQLSTADYRQKMKDFFGKDYNGQTVADRILRRDFNLQYSVPLMSYFLELLSHDSKDCVVRYSDVFAECPPNKSVIEGFKQKLGIDVTSLSWIFKGEEISAIVRKVFEPLLKEVATIMYAYACDVILLSGRPSSLPAIRDLFLKYYPVSPDRLIVLNNYYVGDWYPFGENTGYIKNPKTIVAMGALIGHYASELANLDKFCIDLSLLKENLKSTVNYIEASRDGQAIEYVITPEKSHGDLVISTVPTTLQVRQLGIDSYPSRDLYAIDFNRSKMADRIRRKNAQSNNAPLLSDFKVMKMVEDEIEALKKRMPFKITLERDPDDIEDLSISAIVDKNDDGVIDTNLEIHIQSLGVNDQYWLDSGAFDF